MNFDAATKGLCRKYMVRMILGTDNKNHGEHIKSIQRDEVKAGKDTVEVLSLMIHGCDVSNPSKPWEVCRQWTDLIMDEFYAQGDKEKALGMKTFFDRDVIVLPSFQLGFINGLVLPYFRLLAGIKGINLSVQLKNLDSNCDMWASKV